MKLSNCKTMLFCGILSLFFAGTAPQMLASESDAVAMQQDRVTGTVKDAVGPLIGVAVSEQGTSNGTVTDEDGKFSLEVKPGAVLEINCLGYKTVILTADTAPMDILMEEDSRMLDEVVVTALGIKRDRKALGYGIAEVKGESLTKAKETNVINSMAGRVPGLVVSQTAGGLPALQE